MKLSPDYSVARFWKSGNAFIWLSAGATAVALLLILGVLFVIAAGGLRFFWPMPVERFTLRDGTVVLGQVWGSEKLPQSMATFHGERRYRIRAGNRKLYGEREFISVEEGRITARERPKGVALVEPDEYGTYVGFIDRVEREGLVFEGERARERVRARLRPVAALRARAERIERRDIGDINDAIEGLRVEERALAARGAEPPRRGVEIAARTARLGAAYDSLLAITTALRDSLDAEVMTITTIDRRSATIGLGHVYRVVYPNDMSFGEKAALYASRLVTFVRAAPRDSNVEGGIWPAIFGTVMMTFLMTVVVVPLGVVAGLYLREYAHQGRLVRLVRIAVNNLAGVPSIVFGIFGLGFFVYTLGGSLDRVFFSEALPSPTVGTGGILWSALTLALLTVPVVIVATEEGLASVPLAVREGSLALGASKWETTWRLMLPAASPGILTGVILAISRAAGEVAPLMLTGAVKTARLLPLDGKPPFLHVERKFMHLGFHVYDLGFQSPNVEASKPMVYMTALFLVLIVVLLNLLAMWMRNRLWSRYRSASF